MKLILKAYITIISICFIVGLIATDFYFNNCRLSPKAELNEFDPYHSYQPIEIGCFNIDPGFHNRTFKHSCIITVESISNPLQDCSKQCSESGYFYAIITQSNICVCTSQPFELSYNMTDSKKCEKCDKTHKTLCNNQGMTLYKLPLAYTPEKFPSDEFAPNRLIGCIPWDLNPDFISESKYKYKVPDSKTCILLCGNVNATLAIYKNMSLCRCGNATKIFHYSRSYCEDDNQVEIYRTLVPDYRCDVIKFLPPKQRPLVALFSPPGSGNTWTRYLIEQGSGIYTGSVYNDTGLVKIGHLGEQIDFNRARIIKDHNVHHKLRWRPKYDKYVFLLRNPYNTILSEINRRNSIGHTSHADSENFTGKKFTKSAKMITSHWLLMIQSATEGKIPFLIVPFKELVKQPIEITRKIIDFVDFTHFYENEVEERLICLSQQTNGFAKRKKLNLDFDPFTTELKEYINSHISLAHNVLKMKNVPNDVLSYIKGIRF